MKIIHLCNKTIRPQPKILFRFVIITLAFSVMGLSSCALNTVKMRTGYEPKIAALAKLTVGESGMIEVEKILGKPYGKGRSLLPFQDTVVNVWSYYYEEGTLEDDRRTFLFVYIDDEEKYSGYMWFSSLPDQQVPSG